jgi:hypothetical protein
VKFKSALITQASGSVGGVTFASNQGGLYVRARSKPTNPQSSFQTTIRNALSTLSTAWVQTLTAAQRGSWAAYALNVPLVNTLGDTRSVGALAMYNRCNVPRLQSGLARADSAPTIFTVGEASIIAMTNTAASQAVTVGFAGVNAWSTGTPSGLLCYLSRPQNLSVNFFKGPYRYAGRITGTATGVASPGIITAPFAITAGQRVFFKVVACYADGRLSTPVVGAFQVS